MTDNIKEKISALLDDELESHEINSLTSQLENSSDYQQKLNRYSLISEAIKGECSDCNAADIASRVSQQLENEPTVLAPPTPKKSQNHWLKPVGGAAIAATVAAVAVLNFSSLTGEQDNIEQFPTTVEVSNTAPQFNVPSFTQRASTQWSTESASPEVEYDLNQFLIDHSEYTSQPGIPGMLPYATFVVYDRKK